ncbi:hypothetical protein BDZ91DRAFT_763221 [Kalaharituber pfeilii]|nr:hypothetical protein BDZ91DRAFT_763221 [Kalaharituber pfeilii]
MSVCGGGRGWARQSPQRTRGSGSGPRAEAGHRGVAGQRAAGSGQRAAGLGRGRPSSGLFARRAMPLLCGADWLDRGASPCAPGLLNATQQGQRQPGPTRGRGSLRGQTAQTRETTGGAEDRRERWREEGLLMGEQGTPPANAGAADVIHDFNDCLCEI